MTAAWVLLAALAAASWSQEPVSVEKTAERIRSAAPGKPEKAPGAEAAARSLLRSLSGRAPIQRDGEFIPPTLNRRRSLRDGSMEALSAALVELWGEGKMRPAVRQFSHLEIVHALCGPRVGPAKTKGEAWFYQLGLDGTLLSAARGEFEAPEAEKDLIEAASPARRVGVALDAPALKKRWRKLVPELLKLGPTTSL